MFGLKSTVERSAERLIEEKLYEQVALELQEGKKRAGIWAKALANSNGSEDKAQSLYIQYHVQALKDEMILDNELNKQFTPPKKDTQQKQYKTEEERTKDIIVQNTKEYEHLIAKKKTPQKQYTTVETITIAQEEKNFTILAFIIFAVIVIVLFKATAS